MAFLAEIGLFAGGFLLGTIWFTMVILPIFFGLLRAVFWSIKGLVRFRGALRYLLPPVICLGAIYATALFLYLFFPAAPAYLIESESFALGQSLALVFLLGRAVLFRSGRTGLTAGFLSFLQPYLTESGTEAAQRIQSRQASPI